MADSSILIQIRTALEAGGIEAAKSKLEELTKAEASNTAGKVDNARATQQSAQKAEQFTTALRGLAQSAQGGNVSLESLTNSLRGMLGVAGIGGPYLMAIAGGIAAIVAIAKALWPETDKSAESLNKLADSAVKAGPSLADLAKTHLDMSKDSDSVKRLADQLQAAATAAKTYADARKTLEDAEDRAALAALDREEQAAMAGVPRGSTAADTISAEFDSRRQDIRGRQARRGAVDAGMAAGRDTETAARELRALENEIKLREETARLSKEELDARQRQLVQSGAVSDQQAVIDRLDLPSAGPLSDADRKLLAQAKAQMAAGTVTYDAANVPPHLQAIPQDAARISAYEEQTASMRSRLPGLRSRITTGGLRSQAATIDLSTAQSGPVNADGSPMGPQLSADELQRRYEEAKAAQEQAKAAVDAIGSGDLAKRAQEAVSAKSDAASELSQLQSGRDPSGRKLSSTRAAFLAKQSERRLGELQQEETNAMMAVEEAVNHVTSAYAQSVQNVKDIAERLKGLSNKDRG